MSFIILDFYQSICIRSKYYHYDKPKAIPYKILSEEKEITVNYHAVDLQVDGDLSSYIKQ